MASSNKTDKLQLPQWQLNEKPEMEDFNGAFDKIEDFKDEFDTHLAENATQEKAGHIKLPEDWKTLTLLNGWVGSYTPRYSKDEFGIVHCSGTATGGANALGTSIFEFPPGYRPLDRIYLASRGYKPTTQLFITLVVLRTGIVSLTSSDAPVEIHFNFSFRSDL